MRKLKEWLPTLIFGVLLYLGGFALGTVLFKTDTLSDSMQEAYVLDQINIYRQSHGLDKVYADPASCEYAGKRSGDIVKDFSHENFHPRSNLGVNYTLAVENLAEYYDYDKVVDAWIKSPGHEQNLVSKVEFMCVRKYSKDDQSYWALIGYSK